MSDIHQQIETAILAHNGWKQWLSESIERQKADLNAEALSRDDLCAFGKWLHGSDISQNERASTDYAKVLTWHALFHKEAGHIVALVREGQINQAREAMTQEGQRYF